MDVEFVAGDFPLRFAKPSPVEVHGSNPDTGCSLPEPGTGLPSGLQRAGGG